MHTTFSVSLAVLFTTLQAQPVSDLTVIQHLVHKNSFPGTFGAADGCHVPIKTPVVHTDSYINQQSSVSGSVQFIDISTGWPRSLHDAHIYH